MTRRRLVLLAAAAAALVAIVTIALAAGGGAGAARRASPPEAGSAFGAATEDHAANVVAAAPAGATGRARATPALGLPVPVERAAARLFVVGFGGPGPSRPVLDHLAAHDWGGVVLESGNGGALDGVRAMIDRIGRAAARAGNQPPLIAATQPGDGLNAIAAGPGLEANVPDAPTAQAQAQAAAGKLRALGVRMALAPVADVAAAGGPWEGGAFSDDPATTTTLSAAAVAGWKAGEVAPAPGHFPGEGAASADPSLEPATVGLSMSELRARDLRPFAAIAPQAPAIQLSSATYVAYDGVTPATLLPQVVTLLRRDLRFRGLIVSGDLAAASLAVGRPVAEVAVEALKAGCDLLWVPGDAADQEAAVQAVQRAIASGDVPAARVRDALQRVAVLRATYGVR